MKKYLLFLFAGAVLLAGCNKQAKINGQKIDILSQKIVRLEQAQSSQMVMLQSELTSLAPMLDKMNNSYFEKNRDDALFFHTNTLYLLLTIGKQIETQLQTAESEREMESSLAYGYHTNEMTAMYFCAAQIEDMLASQESNIQNNVNAQIKQMGATLSEQIKSSAPDADEIARRKAMEADVAQIKRDVGAIKARLQITTPSAASP